MLSFKLEGDILTVTQTLMSFRDTKVTSTVIDIVKWHRQQTPELWTVMDRASVEWAQRWHLPRVGVYDSHLCQLPICGRLGIRVSKDGWWPTYNNMVIDRGEIPALYLEMAKDAAEREGTLHGFSW